MTRRHYTGAKLRAYENRKPVRRTFGYRLRRRLRRWVRSGRIDTVLGYVRMWVLMTLVAFFLVVTFASPGSGLLPPPWEGVVAWLGGSAIMGWRAWQVWRDETSSKKTEREGKYGP